MAESTKTTSSNTLLPEQSTTTLNSTTKDSQCADPAHEKIPHHIHFSMPCFSRKPSPDPSSAEPHARPRKNISPPGKGGAVTSDGDMPIFGGYSTADGGNGIGMLGPYPKGYDATKPNNGLPPTPLQECEKNMEEAQRKAFGGK